MQKEDITMKMYKKKSLICENDGISIMKVAKSKYARKTIAGICVVEDDVEDDIPARRCFRLAGKTKNKRVITHKEIIYLQKYIRRQRESLWLKAPDIVCCGGGKDGHCLLRRLGAHNVVSSYANAMYCMRLRRMTKWGEKGGEMFLRTPASQTVKLQHTLKTHSN